MFLLRFHRLQAKALPNRNDEACQLRPPRVAYRTTLCYVTLQRSTLQVQDSVDTPLANAHGDMLDRLRRYVNRHLTLAVDHYGLTKVGSSPQYSCHLTGWFDFVGDQIAGWAEDVLEPSNSNLMIFVVRGREIIASGRVEEKAPTVGWRFAIETGSQVSGDDVLYERVMVLVRDADGNTQALQLEGSTQLELIRERITDPVAPFLEVDFRESGNSSAFVMEGWSGQEKIHRWTVGVQSALALTSPPRDGTYALQLLLWPFTVPGKLTGQRLQVLVNETAIASFGVTRQSLLRCAVPTALSDTPRMVVRFIHPDAASPASLGIGGDSRPLALAFKKVKLARFIADQFERPELGGAHKLRK